MEFSVTNRIISVQCFIYDGHFALSAWYADSVLIKCYDSYIYVYLCITFGTSLVNLDTGARNPWKKNCTCSRGLTKAGTPGVDNFNWLSLSTSEVN